MKNHGRTNKIIKKKKKAVSFVLKTRDIHEGITAISLNTLSGVYCSRQLSFSIMRRNVRLFPPMVVTSVGPEDIFEFLIKDKILKSDKVIANFKGSEMIFPIPIDGGCDDLSSVFKGFDVIETTQQGRVYGKYNFDLISNINMSGILIIENDKILSEKIQISLESRKHKNISIHCFCDAGTTDSEIILKLYDRKYI